jgi:hypothetical protein
MSKILQFMSSAAQALSTGEGDQSLPGARREALQR